jgi:hypothetical protein
MEQIQPRRVVFGVHDVGYVDSAQEESQLKHEL